MMMALLPLIRNFAFLSCIFFLTFSPILAFADFHLWSISEVFSDSTGTVQYIELHSSSGGQTQLAGHQLMTFDKNGQLHASYVFNANLSGDTANRNLLIATTGFTNLTGLSADYLIPDGFVVARGGAVDFADGTDVVDYGENEFPQNGIQSLGENGLPTTASPTNFNSLSATMNVPMSASFNAVSLVMNVPMINVPGLGLVFISFDVNVATLEFSLRDDFFFYSATVLPGDGLAELTAESTLYIPALVIGNDVYEINLFPVSDNPIVFGSPQIISVSTNAIVEPEEYQGY